MNNNPFDIYDTDYCIICFNVYGVENKAEYQADTPFLGHFVSLCENHKGLFLDRTITKIPEQEI